MNPILLNPKIESDKSVPEQLQQMKSYLFQFKEQIELLLMNIDADNMSEKFEDDFAQIVNNKIMNGTQMSQILQSAGQIKLSVENLGSTVASLSLTVDGIEGEVSDLDGNVSRLSLTVNGLSNTVSSIDGTVSSLSNTVNGLDSTVSSLNGTVSSLSNTVDGIYAQVNDPDTGILTQLGILNGEVTASVKFGRNYTGFKITQTNFHIFSSGTFTVASGNFEIDSSGNVKVKAGSGNIGGTSGLEIMSTGLAINGKDAVARGNDGSDYLILGDSTGSTKTIIGGSPICLYGWPYLNDVKVYSTYTQVGGDVRIGSYGGGLFTEKIRVDSSGVEIKGSVTIKTKSVSWETITYLDDTNTAQTITVLKGT